MRPPAAFIVLISLLASNIGAQQFGPPPAPVREVVDTYFGHRVVDPYRWMESKDSEFVLWMKAQNDYARSRLDKLPLRAALFSRLQQLTTASEEPPDIRHSANRWFLVKRGANADDASLYVREGLSGKDRLLLDVKSLVRDGKRYSISGMTPSGDGRYVSYLITPGGSEFGEIHVMDVETGKDLPDRIDNTRFTAGRWLPDNQSFLRIALQSPDSISDPSQRNQNARVLIHKLGTDQKSDKPVFGNGVNPKIVSPPIMIPFPVVPINSKYAFIEQSAGVERNEEIYFTPIDSLGASVIPWKRLASMEDEISSFTIHGDRIYLTTYHNTPNSKLILTSASSPDVAHAQFVFSEKDAIFEGAAVARDALYAQTYKLGKLSLYRIDYGTGHAERVPLPYPGSAGFVMVHDDMDGMLMTEISWTHAPSLFLYNPFTRKSTDTGLFPPSSADMSDVEFENVDVKSWDGTMVPLVILHKRGLKHDGTNPTIMDGYGSYGIENIAPVFEPSLLPWLERGGVYAYPGVRGGGEKGEAWRLAGKDKNKPNSWKDFIACGEYLVRRGYTSPSHLAGIGASAGGILLGNAIAVRPDLFGAAVINVGLTNALRSELTPGGAPNTAEFGSVKTESGFESLLAMDAYSKIRRGVKYPAVLLTTGMNDARVEPWESAKMAARLQAATTSGKPVLLRVDFDAGHGAGVTSTQHSARVADLYAFLFDQIGGRGRIQH